MNCANCGKEIEKQGFDWIHTQSPGRYRCTDSPAPDPQQYATPTHPYEGRITTMAELLREDARRIGFKP